MQVIERQNTVQTSGIKNTVSFGIKQDGLAHIFGILRNSLYSDKILAVIREYSTNSLDAHTEAGKPTLPIKVTLPTRFNPIFKVRDFGLGMSDKDIQETYAFYGASSKRASNAMIGQLGLGSKSAFAYGDNFVITSFTGGKKTTYNAFIDASQIGQIAKLTTEDTDEENGVEISIAVKDHDIQAFHDKALALFQYFKVKPEVNGAAFVYEEKKSVLSGGDWNIFGSGHSSVAVMGNIGYPLDNHWTGDTDVSSVLASGVVIDFAIGDLEISASREKLQYTDRTKQAIKDKLLAVKAVVSKQLNEKFANCATYFDAAKLHGQVMDYGSSLYCLRHLVSGSLMFKGTPVKGNAIYVDAYSTEYTVREYETSYRGNRIKSRVVSAISCRENTVLIDNELNLHSGITNRVYNLVTAGKKVYVLSYGGVAAVKQKFLTSTQLVDANFSLLSSLPKVSLGNGATYVKNSKHSSKEFVYDTASAAKLGYYAKKSDFWATEDVDVESDSGLYVMIDQFCYQDKNGQWHKPLELTGLITRLKTLGINVSKVYGFKAKHKDTLAANASMVNLFDHIIVELEKYFVKNNISQKVANRLEYDSKISKTPWLALIERYGGQANKGTAAVEAHALLALLKCEKEAKALDAAVAWKEFIKPMKPEAEIDAIVKTLNKAYPMLDMLDVWSIQRSKTTYNTLIEYFNLVDG